MKLRRCGSQRFHGWKELQPNKFNVCWSSEEKEFIITATQTQDPTGDNAYYDYELRLSLADIRGIIDIMSHHVVKHEEFSSVFAGMHWDFARLSGAISDMNAMDSDE